MPTKILLCNLYDLTDAQWVEAGASPYLHDDDDVNKIYTGSVGMRTGNYGFENPLGVTHINSVHLVVRGKLEGGGSYFDIDIDEKYTSTNIVTDQRWSGTPTSPYLNKTMDISAIIDTLDKLENCEISFYSKTESGGSPELHITQAWLIVNYGVSEVQKKMLEDEWTFSTTPKFVTQDYGHDTDFELFDANIVAPQVAINEEVQKEYTPVVGSTYRVVHSINILVYVKPTKYSSDAIDTAQELFKGIIDEIDRIYRVKRYLFTGIMEVQLTGWKILTQKKEEPIIFQAIQTVKATYYLT